MAFTNLPPQAYTRDVLAAAYEWLRSQPPSIRELATNSDNLVSLYMQARRRPNSLGHLVPNNAETANPLSSAGAEAFKNDLRHLAEGLKQFDDQKAFVESNNASAIAAASAAAVSAAVGASSSSTPSTSTSAITATSTVSSTSTVAVSSQGLSLDQRSLEVVRKVQQLFNLSNEREALRLLLTVGYEKIRSFTSQS